MPPKKLKTLRRYFILLLYRTFFLSHCFAVRVAYWTVEIADHNGMKAFLSSSGCQLGVDDCIAFGMRC